MSKYNFKIPRVELHAHSMYSVLDGVSSPQEYCDRAKEIGVPALAITDHGTMSGAMDHYLTCKKNGIIPLIGCEVYAAKSLEDKSADGRGVDHVNRHHLILFAKNEVGLSNLYKLTSEAYLNYDRRPIVLVDDIFRLKEGLVCTTACILTLCDSHEWVERFKHEFGDDFYIEINPHDLCDQWDKDLKKFVRDAHNIQVDHNKKMINFSKDHDVKLITTIDAHYSRKEDKVIQDIFILGAAWNKSGWHFSKDDFHLVDSNQGYEMFERYGHGDYFSLEQYENSLWNAWEVVKKCKDINLERPESLLQFNYKKHRYYDPQKANDAKSLVMACIRNSPRFPLLKSQEYLARLQYELSIIEQKGFLDYFLIVDDIINWNLSKGWLVGPGRGSAAGCLLAYMLQITHVDPIKFGLLFERFLSLDRDNYPDMDLDFDKQEETQEYIRETYGHNNVARLGAFQLMRTKTALKDAARVLKGKESFWEMNKITTTIPQGPSGDSVEKEKKFFSSLVDPDNENFNPSLKDYLEENPDVEEAVWKILGKTKTVKDHPCGMVISDRPLAEQIPIFLTKPKDKNKWTTSWNGSQIEKAGLIKFDILGLNTLRDISSCIELVKERHDVDIDVYNLPVDDENVLNDFKSGYTDTVFQFNTPVAKGLLSKGKPKTFADCAVITALGRPGPIKAGMGDTWAARKSGKLPMWQRYNSEGKKENVPYSHPILDKILEETYGVIAYQEQAQRIFVEMGGFTLIESNNVRKIISKSKGDELAKLKPRFVEYATTKLQPSWTKEQVDAFFDDILGFGSYCFNKSHSVAYGYVGYVCAYLKHYYPTEWWGAVAINASENDVKIMMKNMKDFFDDIDINKSKQRFVLHDDKVQMPLRYLKGMGPGGLENIVENQPFSSFEDFIERTSGRSVRKDTVVNLILSGAFRRIEPDRKEMDLIETYFKIKKKEMPEDLVLMRDDMSALRKKKREINPFYKSEWRVGFSHLWKPDVVDYPTAKDLKNRDSVVVVGEIDEIKVSTTKNGELFARMTLIDEGESINIVVWPDKYKAWKKQITKGLIVQITGSINKWNGTTSVVLDDLYNPGLS